MRRCAHCRKFFKPAADNQLYHKECWTSHRWAVQKVRNAEARKERAKPKRAKIARAKQTKWQKKYRARERKTDHFVKVWLGAYNREPKTNVQFYLDNKIYAKMQAWADKRLPLRPRVRGRIPRALRMMVVSAAKVPRDQYGTSLIGPFDEWRTKQGFTTRAEALRWLISDMIARDSR